MSDPTRQDETLPAPQEPPAAPAADAPAGARAALARAAACLSSRRALAALLVGASAFSLTLLVTSVRRVPADSIGVRAADGALLDAGRLYFAWRDSAVAIFPLDVDLRALPLQVRGPSGERLRGSLSLRGRLDTAAARALAGADAGAAAPEARLRAAVAAAVAGALGLRETRALVDASPFALQAPWLPVAGVERGVLIESSEVDMVSVESLRAVAARLHEQGGRAAVEPYLTAIVARRPSDPAPLVVQGDLARIEGDGGRAESLYLQALELEPTFFAPMEALVLQAQVSGTNLERAERLLRRALQEQPESVPHLNWLSLVLTRRGDLPGAESALVRALALEPESAATAVNLAALMDRQGRRDEAIAQLRRVLDKHPDNPMALYNLGSALAEQGDLDGAVAAFEQAEKLSPPSLRLYQRLALAHERRGDAAKAQEYRDKLERLQGARRLPAN